jgi:cysteine dioxygenase
MSFAERLERCLDEITSPDFFKIKHAVERANCDLTSVFPYITAPANSLNYGRNVLFQTDLYEVLVINLPPKEETPIHDHGESFCCVHVVSGVILNRIYKMASPLSVSMLEDEQLYAEGEFFYTPRGNIHSMYNPGHKPMISLHVYSPPLRDTKTYAFGDIRENLSGIFRIGTHDSSKRKGDLNGSRTSISEES